MYDESEEMFLDDDMMMLWVEEPKNYREALADPAWGQTIKSEIEAIEQNNI